MREALLVKVRKIFDELCAVKDAKGLAAEGQVHVYAALAAFAKTHNA